MFHHFNHSPAASPVNMTFSREKVYWFWQDWITTAFFLNCFKWFAVLIVWNDDEALVVWTNHLSSSPDFINDLGNFIAFIHLTLKSRYLGGVRCPGNLVMWWCSDLWVVTSGILFSLIFSWGTWNDGTFCYWLLLSAVLLYQCSEGPHFEPTF